MLVIISESSVLIIDNHQYSCYNACMKVVVAVGSFANSTNIVQSLATQPRQLATTCGGREGGSTASVWALTSRKTGNCSFVYFEMKCSWSLVLLVVVKGAMAMHWLTRQSGPCTASKQNTFAERTVRMVPPRAKLLQFQCVYVCVCMCATKLGHTCPDDRVEPQCEHALPVCSSAARAYDAAIVVRLYACSESSLTAL